MFDIKSILKRGVEKQLMDVDDYIFMPERIELEVDSGKLICVLNSDGRVDLFYSKFGITDVRSAARKHPFTPFETELHHGLYDDVIDDLIDGVNKVIDGESKYFHESRILPSTAPLAIGGSAVDTPTTARPLPTKDKF
ncbi:hypothetical protein [Psychrobacter pygoscelis]|uniref:hypothetical protein n=1 Tax=Psychrobacter pygoscelis TaxID=2488563 RepID=UPI00103F5166|nr:hypothetical protein [Psychrobacter pygoscelis]